jgi:hypothetical protein
MVVQEDTSVEMKIENHEEFVDSHAEPEPVFTIESILFFYVFGKDKLWIGGKRYYMFV